jgi:hypothetical protein
MNGADTTSKLAICPGIPARHLSTCLRPARAHDRACNRQLAKQYTELEPQMKRARHLLPAFISFVSLAL